MFQKIAMIPGKMYNNHSVIALSLWHGHFVRRELYNCDFLTFSFMLEAQSRMVFDIASYILNALKPLPTA